MSNAEQEVIVLRKKVAELEKSIDTMMTENYAIHMQLASLEELYIQISEKYLDKKVVRNLENAVA